MLKDLLSGLLMWTQMTSWTDVLKNPMLVISRVFCHHDWVDLQKSFVDICRNPISPDYSDKPTVLIKSRCLKCGRYKKKQFLLNV